MPYRSALEVYDHDKALHKSTFTLPYPPVKFAVSVVPEMDGRKTLKLETETRRL